MKIGVVLAVLLLGSVQVVQAEQPTPFGCPKEAKLRKSTRGNETTLECVRPNGVRHGTAVLWRAGVRVAEVSFQDGKKHGTFKQWHPNGKPRIFGSMHTGRLDGKYSQWKADGSLEFEGAFKQGKKSGRWVIWHEGQKHSGMMTDDAREGIWTQHYQSGKRSALGSYERGEKSGKWTEWHENGRRAEEGRYVQGKKVGLWTYWHPSGKMSSQGHYRAGKEVGLWHEWDETGAPKTTPAAAARKRQHSMFKTALASAVAHKKGARLANKGHLAAKHLCNLVQRKSTNTRSFNAKCPIRESTRVGALTVGSGQRKCSSKELVTFARKQRAIERQIQIAKQRIKKLATNAHRLGGSFFIDYTRMMTRAHLCYCPSADDGLPGPCHD